MPIAQVPLQPTTSERTFAALFPLPTKNRVYEQSPTEPQGTAMLARPGSSVLTTLGSGPIRAIYSLPGLHGDALFVVSGNYLYRYNTDGTTIPIGGFVFGTGAVSMCGVAGAGYQRLFVADGSHLQFYAGGTHASGTLTGTVHVSNGDTVQINNTYYMWVDSVVNGSGTAADPWRVLRGANLATDLANLNAAINFTGVAGTTYSADLGGQNTDVTSTVTATTLTVTAISDLAAPNTYPTTVPVGTAVTWGATTLTGGGTHGLSGVAVPDGLPPGTLGVLKSFVIVTIIGKGKFFWIQPGAVVINALDFATAESRPDATLKVEIVGDTAWFIGTDSTEVWYTTGNSNAPFAPISGRVYDRGAIEGTTVNVKGTVFLVGPDHTVYAIAGSPQRVSDNGIEELIRRTLGG